MKTLFIQLRRIGDVLMTTPAIRAFKKKYPDSELHYLTEIPADELLMNNPYIDKIIKYNPYYNRFKNLIKEIQKNKYDVVIDFFGNPRSSWLAFLSTAKKRIGFDYRLRKLAYTHRLKLKNIHRVYSAGIKLHLLEFLDICDDDIGIEIYLNNKELDRAKNWLTNHNIAEQEFCVISPVSRKDYKRWQLEKYGEIIKYLISKNLKTVIIYGPSEIYEALSVNGYSNDKAVLIDDGMSLREVASIIKFARFYLGNDNVHKHIARAVGIPTFTIFGPVGALSWTDPVFPIQYYFEKYIKCRKKCNINKCKDYKCIKEVEVAEVIQRLE
ncbi:MAG: glycosyltransferase family 9 protein, partial [Candidatus Hydrogenedentota bacterium]